MVLKYTYLKIPKIKISIDILLKKKNRENMLGESIVQQNIIYYI